jgi:uncharacterized membrane protein
MAEAGNMMLSEVMLWLMYIALAIAVVAVIVSEIRYVFTQKKGRS